MVIVTESKSILCKSPIDSTSLALYYMSVVQQWYGRSYSLISL